MKAISAALAGVALAAAMSAARASDASEYGEPLSAPGPQGELAGTLIRPADGKPLVLILPGSGPTDRDGNNPIGVRAAPYRLLAQELAKQGIGTLRIDKRGMFASRHAIADPNAVTIADYAEDARKWIAVASAASAATGRECIWLAGHSEGGLIALVAAQNAPNLCGVILLAAPGRTMGEILRSQIRANPANAPLLPDALGAIDRLEKGERVDVGAMHPALQQLFAPSVQGFLIDMMRHDPAALAAKVSVPLLIVQGGKDIQIGQADGDALHAANPAARFVVIPAMNHVLKTVAGDDRQANVAAYLDPALPIAPELVAAVADFVTTPAKENR